MAGDHREIHLESVNGNELAQDSVSDYAVLLRRGMMQVSQGLNMP
jgi:hypothetical protein